MASLHLAQEIFKLIYPVGSIYLSTSTTNPSTYFGGTWEQVAKESYLLGYNGSNTWFDQPGQNKGSKNGPGSWNTTNHTLTIDQIPAHKHSGSTKKGKTDFMRIVGAVGTSETSNHMPGYSAGAYKDMGLGELNFPGSNHWHDFDTNNTGGGKGHNHFHVSPYYIVVVWKRTA